MRLLLRYFNIFSIIPTLLAQTPNSDQYFLDAESFFDSLADSPTWSSQAAFIATDPGLAENLAVATALADIDPLLIPELPDPTAYFAAAVAAVPAPAQPIFASVYSDMLSIAAKDGITGIGTATGASGSYSYTLPTITALGSELGSIAAGITSGLSSLITAAPTMVSVTNSAVAGVPTGPGNMSVSSSTAPSNGGSPMASTSSVTIAAVTGGSATTSPVAPTTSSHNMAARHTMLAGGVVAGVAALAILL